MAGASKSKQSLSAQADRNRNNRYGVRKTGFRDPQPVVVIVCDDEVTAPRYFNELQKLYKGRVYIKIVRKPYSYAGPSAVVGCAVQEYQRIQNSNDDYDRQAAWAIIDLEHTDKQRREARAAKTKGEKVGIGVALSDPCFEVWTLLHLRDTGESFERCRAVLERVEKEWKNKFAKDFGRKGQADYSKILPLRSDAAKRAKQHYEKTPRDPSWTEIYKVIEDIDRLAGPTAT